MQVSDIGSKLKKSDMTVGLLLSACMLVAAVFFSLAFFSLNVCAQQLDVDIDTVGSAAYLTDGSYYTGNDYAAGDTVVITSETPIDSIYVIWDSPVSEWTLEYSGTSASLRVSGASSASGISQSTVANASDSAVQCGTNGFLHEYVKLPQASYSATINISDTSKICAVYAFSEGELPDFVQTWEAPCSEADILVFSTHADDEILFLGGVLATYGGQQGLPVQVCYMTNYWNGQYIREHEKLDGLWESGIRNYPVNGEFDDIYSETLEEAQSSYDYEAALEYVTEQIRRFKPNVVVTQDINGEYGHGGHMLLAKAVCEAVDNSMNETFFSEQAAKYGTWDVPKTYLHLYGENRVRLNLNEALSRLGGRTAIEVAEEAYLKHVSQQWCWFYVSDTYQYSCAEFGLYRTTVGADTVTGYAADGTADGSSADFMEHITTHAEVAAQKKAQEESSMAEEASKKASESRSKDLQSEALSPAAASAALNSSVDTSIIPALIVFAAMIILLILMLVFIVMYNQKRKRKKHR